MNPNSYFLSLVRRSPQSDEPLRLSALVSKGIRFFVLLLPPARTTTLPPSTTRPSSSFLLRRGESRSYTRLKHGDFGAAAVEALEIKEQILGILGKHPRIVYPKWKHEDGLLLEYLPNGSVEHYPRSYTTYTSAEQYGCAKMITTATSVFIEG